MREGLDSPLKLFLRHAKAYFEPIFPWVAFGYFF